MTTCNSDTKAALASVRVFVLLAWSGVVGLPATPVGVLAVDGASGAFWVVWMPMIYDAATAWRRRLRQAAGVDIRASLDAWLEQTSALTLAELPVSEGDLRVCAEAGLERLLAIGAR